MIKLCARRRSFVLRLAPNSLSQEALPVASTVDLTGVPMRQGTVVINRTITVPTDNKNLITISYATTANSPISLKLNTTLTTPAQGWCP
jgi:hypothetical protein